MGDLNDPFMRNRDNSMQARPKAHNRANVLQLKLMGQGHPTGLTTNLLKLFEPRPPLEYKPPPEKRKCPSYTGMAQFVSNFAEPGDPEYAPPVKEGETSTQRRERVHKLRLEEGAAKVAEELQKYDPSNDPNVTGDPYKTLFVARLNFETTEHRIKREFEAYGPIKRVGILEHPQGGIRFCLLASVTGSVIWWLYAVAFWGIFALFPLVVNFMKFEFWRRVRMITDKAANKPRGYAFIEYMHTRDMKAAYKQADGRKLDNKRVLVDVERGRTVPNWRPRRLGGGLGSTRVGGEEVNQKYSGREPQQIASGGPPRSEEPRSREDRHVDREREKSRDRGRDRDLDRERSRERSHDRTRDRDPREERHRRDRDRNRDKEKERGRGRDRDRDRGRDNEKDQDRERNRDRDRGRDRPREREKDYDRGDYEQDSRRDRSRSESKHERDRLVDTEREYDRIESENDRGWYDHVQHGHGYGRVESDREHGQYEPDEDRVDGASDHFGLKDDQKHYSHDPEPYEQVEPEDHRYDQEDRKRDQDREYERSERSISHEYER